MAVSARKAMYFCNALLSISYCLCLDLMDLVFTDYDPAQRNEWRRTRIDDYGDEEARFYFSFMGAQLRIILEMLDLPEELRNNNGSVFLMASKTILIILKSNI